jgi:diguanylate cyclase (GGDEF)-like protein
MGSIIGLRESLTSISPSLSLTDQLIIQAICAIVNCLQPLIATYLIKKYGQHKDIFAHLYSVWVFIVVAMFTPLISAFVAINTLFFVGVIVIEQYAISFLTWWLASTVAHLIFTPSLLIYREKDILSVSANIWEIVLVLFLLYFNCILVFQYSYPLEYLLLLVLIWSVFRLSRFYSSLMIIAVALITLVATSKGYGVFIKASPNESLLFLQSFVAVLSISTLILTAIFNEKQQTQLSLQNTLDNLENKVIERTKKLEQTQLHLEEVNNSLAKMVNTDGLTLIANRRCFDEYLSQEWEKLYQSNQSISLLLIDVDYFKLYNDAYGHQSGDDCLKKIAQALKKSCVRSSDLVARYGGEEFAILLSKTNIDGAIAVSQRIKTTIHNLQITHNYSPINHLVTVSIGISSLTPTPDNSPQLLINQADQALYLSKEKGRNQYNIYSESLQVT